MQLRRAGNTAQYTFGNERAGVNDHFGVAQQAVCFERQQLRIARPGADEIYFPLSDILHL